MGIAEQLTDEVLSKAEYAFGEAYVHARGTVEECRRIGSAAMRAVLVSALAPLVEQTPPSVGDLVWMPKPPFNYLRHRIGSVVRSDVQVARTDALGYDSFGIIEVAFNDGQHLTQSHWSNFVRVAAPAVSALAALPGEPERATTHISSLADEIASALNRHSAENESNTPDYILAKFLLGCLQAWDNGTRERERWYGRSPNDCQPAQRPDTEATRGESREEFERDRFGETGDRHRKALAEQLRDDAEAAP